MKIWRESHHADRSTYEAWRQQAAWYYRAFDWTRHAFPRWVQKMLGDWGLDPNAEKIELENGVRPSDLNRAKFRQSIPARRSRYAIVAIPKKKGEKVEPDPGGVKREEVWGLQFEEGFTIHRLLFYLLVLYFLGNIVAVIHLFQEASGPVSMANKLWIFGWIASFVTLLLTVWLKWAETPKWSCGKEKPMATKTSSLDSISCNLHGHVLNVSTKKHDVLLFRSNWTRLSKIDFPLRVMYVQVNICRVRIQAHSFRCTLYARRFRNKTTFLKSLSWKKQTNFNRYWVKHIFSSCGFKPCWFKSHVAATSWGEGFRTPQARRGVPAEDLPPSAEFIFFLK